MFKPVHGLVVRDWKQDVVNLIHLPRAKSIPELSPFALKLETWLRFTKLNYVNVSNDFNKGSVKGQIPFIELNGRQIADSSNAIEHLIQTYNLPIDRNLTTRERAEARAITVLVEDSIAKCMMYDRSQNVKWMYGAEKGYLPHFHGVKKVIAQNLVPIKVNSMMKKRLAALGIAQNSPDENDEILKKDLTALSVFLGEKRYFFGDRPTTIDATVFGMLAQLYFAPLNSDKIVPFIDQNTPNLAEFLNRIKSEYWPDWQATCETLNANIHNAQPPGEAVIHATGPSH